MRRRLISAGVLLVALITIYNLWPAQFAVIGSVGLLVGWLVTVVTAWDLVMLSRMDGLSRLAQAQLERDARDAVALAIGSTGIGVVAVITIGRAVRDALGLSLPLLDLFPQGSLLVLLLFGLLMMAAPGVNWFLYWHRVKD